MGHTCQSIHYDLKLKSIKMLNSHIFLKIKKPNIRYQSLAIEDVIDKDIMLDLRALSYGSAIELKSIMLIPPASDKLFIDSLRLEYFSRFFSRFDLPQITIVN